MVNRELLNEVAKWGLVLGVLMGASRIFESSLILSGEASKFMILSVEWLLSVVVFVYIIYKANKRRADAMPKWIGYPMGVAINYSITISIFASLIVGICSHIYIVSEVGGYDIYAERAMGSLQSVIAELQLPESTAALYDEAFDTVESATNAEEWESPTMLTTLISFLSNYIVAGLIVGFFVSLFVRRKAEVADVINDVDQSNKSE